MLYQSATIVLDNGNTARRSWSGDPLLSWDVIARAVADLCECDPDDVDCAEDEAGEFLTVRGARVGVYHRRF